MTYKRHYLSPDTLRWYKGLFWEQLRLPKDRWWEYNLAGHSHSLIAAIRIPATAQSNHLSCQYSACSQYLLLHATMHPKIEAFVTVTAICFLSPHSCSTFMPIYQPGAGLISLSTFLIALDTLCVRLDGWMSLEQLLQEVWFILDLLLISQHDRCDAEIPIPW